ncbi:MAG: SUMF1/EgtB/PvdO family nonheme iron enzyme [bacterium]|nr:SUMF1/EgtB/PvdO family nonheme iron enzyme [bacterium]
MIQNSFKKRFGSDRNFFSFFLLACLLWPNQTVFAQNKPKSFHEVKSLKKNFVKVGKTLYACKYETSNYDYVSFLNDVKMRMNPAIYLSLLPDTAKWRDPGSNSEPFVIYYLHHPAYANYPLVNISYEQANFYCNWLTQQFNKDPKRPFKKAVFKLPSRTEWQQAAAAGNMRNKFPWGSTLDSLPKGIVVNYCERDYVQKVLFDSMYSNDGKRIKPKDSVDIKTECKPYSNKENFTQPVNLKKAKQSKNGLYHVSGNVSEMIAYKGDCIGGNFRSRADWLRIDAPNEFYPGYLACPLIGFRVFLQVLEP